MRNPARYQQGRIEFHLPKTANRVNFHLLVDGEVMLNTDGNLHDGSKCSVGRGGMAFRRCYFDLVNAKPRIISDLTVEVAMTRITNDEIDDDRAVVASGEDLAEETMVADIGDFKANKRFYINVRGADMEWGVEDLYNSPI